MASVPDLLALRRRIDLPIARRARGLLDGTHPSLLRGHGDEFDDLLLYAPGDDVGDIDWKSSARAGVPIIKRYESRRTVPLLLAVDTGREMAATAASGEPKSDVAVAAAALLAQVARDRGDPVGVVAADAGRLVRVPARTGAEHVQVALRQVERAFGVDAPPSDLPRLLRQAASYPRRGLVVLVTDDGSPAPEHEPALRRLRDKHDLMVLSVADVDPLRPDDGTGPTTDVADRWEVPAEVLGRPELQAALARHRAGARAYRAAMLRRLGTTDVVVDGTDDLVPALVAAARRRRAHR